MKRFIAVLAVIMLIAALAGCAKSEPIEPPTVPGTEPPTTPLYIDTPVDEPEWTLAEGKLTLEDDTTVYAEGDDFLYFAIVGADPASMELRFKLDELTAAALSAQGEGKSYFITHNGERIGTATLSADGSVATITSANAAEEITTLATRIRGLE